MIRRILVMGPPGSGKSTFARRLGARFGLPVFHLDQVYWRPGWVKAPAEHFLAEVERIAALAAWVIDGNYTKAIAPRLGAAEAVIYLDVPRWLCMLRILRRITVGYGRVRIDSAAGCPERLDREFLCYAWAWHRTRHQATLALIEDFAGRTMISARRSIVPP